MKVAWRGWPQGKGPVEGTLGRVAWARSDRAPDHGAPPSALELEAPSCSWWEGGRLFPEEPRVPTRKAHVHGHWACLSLPRFVPPTATTSQGSRGAGGADATATWFSICVSRTGCAEREAGLAQSHLLSVHQARRGD